MTPTRLRCRARNHDDRRDAGDARRRRCCAAPRCRRRPGRPAVRRRLAGPQAGLRRRRGRDSSTTSTSSRRTTTTGRSAPTVAADRRPVNQKWDGTGADPRRWRTLPGHEGAVHDRAAPARPAPRASPAAADSTMLDRGHRHVQDPHHRPGRQHDAQRSSPPSGATSFLDFLYFTDFETLDPVAYTARPTDSPGWATTNCSRLRGRPPRRLPRHPVHHRRRERGPVPHERHILACGGYTLGRKRPTGSRSRRPAGPAAGTRAGSCSARRPEHHGHALQPGGHARRCRPPTPR